MKTYKVTVGNIGVYSGTSKTEAQSIFKEYVQESQDKPVAGTVERGACPAAGGNVTFYENDEPLLEFIAPVRPVV